MLDLESIAPSCVNDDESPWIYFDSGMTTGEQVGVKYFQIDPVRGEVIFLSKIPAGKLPKHYHAGPVIVYTIEGSWHYEEHDWIARAGSLVYEVSASFHTAEIYEPVTVLNILQGEVHHLDEDGKVAAVESWKTHMERYLSFCKTSGITPRDLTDLNMARLS